jgi:hypothetical protein
MNKVDVMTYVEVVQHLSSTLQKELKGKELDQMKCINNPR